MKKTIFALCALLLSGCGVILRYNYVGAINNIPPGSRLVYVNNDYVEYTNSTGWYKAHYRADTGEIVKTDKVAPHY
jgi:hypothetical protein